MEEKLIIAVANHPVLYDQSLLTYRDTTGGTRHGGRWQRQWVKLVGFRLFGDFISSLLRFNIAIALYVGGGRFM